MAVQGTKPYIKLASTLVLLGMGMFTLEQYGLARLDAPAHSMHIDPNVLSLLVLAPMALIVGGAVVFVVGRIRRL
jgi:hypothetical protein